MAKVLKYQLCTGAGKEKILSPVTMGWNEVNEELAKKEAYNGLYTVEDDGTEPPVSQEERIRELEEALALLLSGVTE